MKQRSGSSSLSALKLKSFANLVKWCAAHYTRHMKCHVSLRDLYGLCVNARTDSGKSLAVWMNQNQTIPGWFPEHITRVFSGISVWKRLVWMNQNQTIPGWFPEHITRVFSGISVWKRLKSYSITCPQTNTAHQGFYLWHMFPNFFDLKYSLEIPLRF